MLGSFAAIAVVVVGGFFAIRSVGIQEAERDTRERVQSAGRLVEASGVTDGLLKGNPDAIAKLDEIVLTQVLSASIVRVKLWSENGTVLYSDEAPLIGQRFKLGAEEADLLRKGGAEAELSDLTKPENRYERPQGKLLEAHTPIRTPNGTPVLFEIYQRFSSVSANGERLLRALAPPLLGGLLVLLLFQAPLAWSLARRLQRGHREREALLANAIEASAQERRRIASDLHDGVVQDLAGVAFGLAPLAEDAARRDADAEARVLRDSMGRLRQGVRDLRTLLVEIHPPSLESTGLEAALNDLLSPLQSDGIETDLHVDDRATAGSTGDALVYRVAREALRNVQKYAGAESVRIEVTRPEAHTTRLVVEDDGRGFSPDERERRGEEGHVGLTLLEGLVQQSNGRLAVRSEPGRGTTVELEVPAQ
ncbi:MAG: two-component system, NarL family, sensor kinase [Solirubrobacteraceae bacterium]|jgi:signal transduction histidine kinase|nr:two-component system, NarL family, sensor kinase [Solirubrobacteraceae bacterium]